MNDDWEEKMFILGILMTGKGHEGASGVLEMFYFLI